MNNRNFYVEFYLILLSLFISSHARSFSLSAFLSPNFERSAKSILSHQYGNIQTFMIKENDASEESLQFPLTKDILDPSKQNENDRRSFVKQCIQLSTSSAMLSTIQIPNAIATPDSNENNNIYSNFDCLLDLPPVTKDCTRVYLCRHGQTENNRLKIIQGSRIDAPLNPTGQEQASRLGVAISRLTNDSNGDAAVIPTTVKHSLLRRARETAELAVQSCSLERRKGNRNDDTLPFEILPSLAEVDFGPVVDGKPSSEVKPKMKEVYAKWSVGLIDEKEGGNGEEGGESARDVLKRVEKTIQTLSQPSSTNKGSEYAPTLVVAHSTYIKMLLAATMEMPLAEAAFLDLKNCCVNVLDINIKGKTRKIGAKSPLFGGQLSLVKKDDVSFEFPYVHVIRMNEYRHLGNLA